MKTRLTIQEDKFLINGQYTYVEIKDTRYEGFLMNARFIQGVFDDASGRERYQRFGRVFDPEKNTDDLIRALPEWYVCCHCGLPGRRTSLYNRQQDDYQ